MQTFGKYILNEHGDAVPEVNLWRWVNWFEAHTPSVVTQTDIGPLQVSTVFLGINHRWDPGPPILWETMIFGPGGHPLAGWQRRCAGVMREQAEAMHAEAVQLVRERFGEHAENFNKVN